MGNFSWLSAFVGFMVAILFEEVFIRSGKHPVSIQIDPTVLQSIPNDPELELLLELEYFRNQSLVQQSALRESKRDHESLTQKLEDLQRDFHMTIAPQVHTSAQIGPGLTKRTMTPECSLNVRLARQKACPSELEACPVFYRGYDCTTGIEKVPDCLAPWKVPFNETANVPFTLSRDSLKKLGYSAITPILEFGYYPASRTTVDGKENQKVPMEKMTLPISHDIMELLPRKEVLDKNLYRSCALVGSSAQLMQQNYSKIIDNHDIVVRLNGAVVRGYEDKVGSQTHLRFVTSQWLGYRELATEKIIHLDHESEDPLYGCDVETECTHAASTMARYVEFLMLKKKVNTHTIHPEVAKWLRTKQNRTYAGEELEIMGSTGFQAMLMMLHVCEKVDLFGFSGSTSQKYFDDSQRLHKQTELLAKWRQEIYVANEEKDKYYHGNSLSRRLLATTMLEEGGERQASDVQDDDQILETTEVFDSEDARLHEQEALETLTVRDLQRRHRKKAPPPPPPKKKKKKKVIEVEELDTGHIPESVANGLITGFLVDLEYERNCQQDLVNKGIVTNYGAHVDLSFIEAEHKSIQNSLAKRLDKQEEDIMQSAAGESADTEEN